MFILAVAHFKKLAKASGGHQSFWGEYSPEAQRLLGPFTKEQATNKGQLLAGEKATEFGTELKVSKFCEADAPLAFEVRDNKGIPQILFQVCQIPCEFHAGIPFAHTLKLSQVEA